MILVIINKDTFEGVFPLISSVFFRHLCRFRFFYCCILIF